MKKLTFSLVIATLISTLSLAQKANYERNIRKTKNEIVATKGIIIQGIVTDKISKVPKQGAEISLFRRVIDKLPDGSLSMRKISESIDLDKKITTDKNGNYAIPISKNEIGNYLMLKIKLHGYDGGVYSFFKVDSGITTYQLDFQLIKEVLTQAEREQLDVIIWQEKAKVEQEKIKDIPLLPVNNYGQKSLQNQNSNQSLTSCSFTVPSTVMVLNLHNGYNGTSCSGTGFTGSINFDDYIAGVVEGEMNGFPLEAKKVQAVAARTYSMYRIYVAGYTYANCGQAYNSGYTATSSLTASYSTSTMILLYNGNVIDALYAARCNGNYTQNGNEGTFNPYANCNLSGSITPYLQSVTCSGHMNCNSTSETPCCNVMISTAGTLGYIFGHGVGMCQRGAQGFAGSQTFDQILTHFYTGVCIANFSGVSCSQPSNDYCSTPATISPIASCTYIQGTTCGATPPTNGLATTCSANTPPDDDVWYQFTANSTSHTITLQAITSTFDGVIELMSGSCPSSLSNLACANNFGVGSTETLIATGLTVGNTYFIRVFSNGNGVASTGDFNVCITSSSTCNPVSVTIQPTNQSATVGGTATFSVVAGGTGPFTYQWYKNGIAISGATNATYQTPTLSTSDNGNTYYCHITNCTGSNSINTNSVVLTVSSTCTGVTIATQPNNQSTTVGNTVTFSISANGTAPFTYQWYKNGIAISGATNYFYTTSSLTLSDNGNTYYCYITNCSGSNNATSNTATLTVTNTCNAVSIATQPANQSSIVGGTATFSITANGTAPFSYQWYKNGAAIIGATSNSYTTPILSISDNGNYYYCVVTNCNSSYSATSNNATLTVVPSCTAISITSQSSTQYTTVGGSVTFVVNVSGTAPFTYQWYKNGTLISGATNSSYTTPSLTLSDDGNYYYCIITNCSGANLVTSANAYVYVNVANTCSNCPCWNWAKSSTGTIASIGNIAIDANQNSYVTGSYSSSTITFGSVTLTNNGGNDVFLVKYDSTGNVIWAKSAGGSGNDISYGVAVDKNDNVFVTGNFGSSSITFGSTTLSNTGFYIVKYNSAGAVQWAKDATSRVFSHNAGTCIVTDTSGNVFVTGSYNGGTYNEIFVEKYSPIGTVLWTKNSTNSNGYGYAGGIATDITGNVYITGSCSANTNFSGSLWGIAGFYMVKFNSSGTPQWIVGPQGSGGGTGTGITVDLNGNVFMTGYFTGSSITCGGNVASNSNPGSTDILLVQYGNPSSVWSIGGASNDEGYNITTDAAGNVFVTGMFQSSSVNFPLSNAISNIGTYTNDYDAFIVKYTSGFFGNISQWAKAIDGGQTRSYGAVVNSQGNSIFLTGNYTNTAIFNNDTLRNYGGSNVFTTKLSFNGTAQPQSILGSTNVCSGSTQTYSISPVSGATSYVWQATNGTVSGTGTTVSVTWNNTSSGAIQVASQNSCGISAYQTLNVILNGLPEQPNAILGNSAPCQNSTETYSINAVSGATSYIWQATNGTVTGSGTNISVTWNSGGTGVLQVAAVGPCGQGAFKVLNLTILSSPSQPGAIIGNANACASSTEAYSISPVAGATGYSWLCTNGTVTGNGTSVTVAWNSGTSGILQVAAQNTCGLSAYQTLNVNLNNPPSQPGSITGILTPCAGSINSYSISPVANATSYNWQLPSGWQGNSTTTNINTVTGGTSGAISISAINTCGSSTPQSLTVNSIPLPNISVNSPVICVGQTAVLIATGANTYSWSSGLIATGDTAYSSPVVTTNYSVVGTLNGCSNIGYSTVTVNSPSSGTINGLPIVVCFNHTPINITGTPTGGSFSGDGINGTTFNPSNATIGSNTITYEYISNGCNATTSQNIQVDTLVNPSISAIGNTSFCIGDSVTIVGNISNGIWSNSSSLPAITVSSSGTYFVTNTTTCGSANSNQIVVTVYPLPTASISYTNSGNIFNFSSNAQANPTTYTWNFGDGDTSSLVNPTHTYLQTGNFNVSLTVSNNCGSNTYHQAININTNCNYTLSQNTVIADSNGTSQLILVSCGDTCTWNVNIGNCSWITATPLSGNGVSNTFTVTIPATIDTFTKQCTLTVEGHPVSITQYGKSGSTPCAPIDTSIQINGGCDLAATSILGATYQWYRNGAVISGATSQYYTAVQNGYYHVSIAVGNCLYQSNDHYLTCLTGLEESAIGDLKVYPNPTYDHFVISGESARGKQFLVYLYNTLGQMVYFKVVPLNNIAFHEEISVGDLSAGIYHLQILVGEQHYNQKLIIK